MTRDRRKDLNIGREIETERIQRATERYRET